MKTDQLTEKRIILADDHVVVRNGLKAIIEKLGAYKVIGEYNDGLELITALSTIQPDLIIMDVSMPRMGAEETMQILKGQGSKIPVLILTLNEDESRVIRLFRLGVRGYLSKSCSAATMSDALAEIFRRGYYHNEYMQASLMNDAAGVKQDGVIEKLSSREREFLKLVCDEKEYTYEQIADIMGVQPRTVDGYRESLFDKFSIKSKTGLVLFVLRHKLYDLL